MASSSKWKSSYDSGRKYNKTWESKFTWLSKTSDGSEDGFCKLCHTSIKPKQSNFTKHEKSEKHVQRIKSLKSTKKIEVVRNPTVAEELKTVEIAMACHSSILSVDHLGEIVARNAEGSSIANMKMHRTKCTKILTNIVGPALKEELITEVKGKNFLLSSMRQRTFQRPSNSASSFVIIVT